jgi:hypothetical protein
VTLSADAATDPNSNTVMSGARDTSTAPCMPGTSAAGFAFGLSAGLGLESGCCGLPLNQERSPMAWIGCVSLRVKWAQCFNIYYWGLGFDKMTEIAFGFYG